MVMLILKRRYEFWFSIIALHKIGAVAIPATHLLTGKDIIYRNNAADIKMIVCAGEEVILNHVKDALPYSPSVKHLVSAGPIVPHGFEDFQKGVLGAAPFVKPEHPNRNDDISLMYFTSGTTGEPKMVAHDFTYPLGHIATGCYWHNLHEDSLHLTVADTGWGKAVWGKLYGQWIAGATVFVYDHEKFHPADILQMIQNYHITSLCAPPTVFRFLIREDLTHYDLSSLQYCTIAGEALNPAVYETFRKLTGIKLMDGFRESVEYSPKPGVKKQVVYFLGTTEQEKLIRQEEEISEIMSKVSLKQLAAPCILYNLNGYYDHLKALLAHMIDMGLSTPERQEGIYFAEMLDDIRAILKI